MIHRDWLTDILGKGRVSFRVPLVILLMAVGLLTSHTESCGLQSQ